MYWDSLSGRTERRLSIAVVVWLGVLDRAGAREYEKTHTDNLSAHGVRVKTKRLASWRTGQDPSTTGTQGLINIRNQSYISIQGFEIRNYQT